MTLALTLLLLLLQQKLLLQVFTLTAADAQSSLQLARAGVPVGEQIAPPVAAARRRRLQQAGDSKADSGAWSAQPELQEVDEELNARLEEELKQKLRTGQHAASALAGVKVHRMVHKHMDGGAGEGMGHAGHQK